MRRRKLRKYHMIEDFFILIFGVSLLSLIGIVGGYESDTMTTIMFFAELVIALETMLVSYMAYKCAKCKEKRYIRLMMEDKKKNMKMKKSA